MAKLQWKQAGRWILAALLSIAIMGTILLLFSDWKKLKAAFWGISLMAWGKLAVCFFAWQFLRACKWEFFLRCLRIAVPMKASLRIYLAGYALTLTPGRMGEMVQAYLLKKEFGIAFSKVAPIIFASRITGFFAALILCLATSLQFVFLQGTDFIFSGFLMVCVLAAGLVFFRCKPFGRHMAVLLAGLSLRRRMYCAVYKMYLGIYSLLSLQRLFVAVLISIMYWFAEGVLFSLALDAFCIPARLSMAIFILSSSSMVGALSMMPGSAGVLEGGIVGLLMYLCGTDFTLASGAALLHRFFSLWLPMGMGCMVLGWGLHNTMNSENV